MSGEEDRNIQIVNTGGGAYVAGGVDTGGGDFAGRDLTKITINFNFAPIQLRAPLRNLFSELIADYTTLFAGRTNTLQKIRAFIEDRAGGYLVITAPAGFGKTALSANLIAGRPDAFAYHFFTQLYGKESLEERFFLKNVVQQLAAWHDQKGELPENLHELRALYKDLIARPLKGTQVLVLDGLDEIKGLDLEGPGGTDLTRWDPAPYLSGALPPGMHVIVTIRDVGQNWVELYRFPPGQTRHLPLDGLDRTGVAQVFRAAGAQAATFADSPALLDQVMEVSAYAEVETDRPVPAFRITRADPFYVNLIAQDAAAGNLTPAQLGERPQGLKNYLDDWLKEIVAFAEGNRYQQAIYDLLGTLSVALGPVQRQDLETLHGSLRAGGFVKVFPQVIERVRRFVKGDDESGYALMHPRLRRHLRGHADFDVTQYHDGLLAYCRGWQENHSPYALFYYPEHLFLQGDYAALFSLMDRPWKEALEGQLSYQTTFAGDLELSLHAAGNTQPPNLLEFFRSGLIYATLVTQSRTIPISALIALAEMGRMDMVLQQVQLFQDPDKKIEAYQTISHGLIDKGEMDAAVRLLTLARKLLGDLNFDQGSDALLIAKGLAEAGAHETALEVIDGIPIDAYTEEEILYVWEQIDGWAYIGEQLASAGHPDRAAEAAKKAWSQAQWMEILEDKKNLYPRLAILCCEAGAIDLALEILQRTEPDWGQDAVIVALAVAYLQARRVEEGIAELDRITDPWDRAYHLASHADQLGDEVILNEILSYVEEMAQSPTGAHPLWGLTARLAENGRFEVAVSLLDAYSQSFLETHDTALGGGDQELSQAAQQKVDSIHATRALGYIKLAVQRQRSDYQASPTEYIDKARGSVVLITDPGIKDRTLAEFPGPMMYLGLAGAAEDVQDELVSNPAQITGWLGMARALVDKDRAHESRPHLTAAYAALEAGLLEYPEWDVLPVLVQIAGLAAAAGDAALTTTAVAKAGAAIPIDRTGNFWVYLDLAAALETAGAFELVPAWLEKALLDVAPVADSWPKARVFTTSLVSLSNAGYPDKVAETVQKLSESEDMEVITQVERMLVDERMANLAALLVPDLEKSPDANFLLLNIIGGLAHQGLYEQALTLTDRLTRAWNVENGLMIIASELALAGDLPAALATIERVNQTPRRAEVLGQVALALAHAGKNTHALEMAERALAAGRFLEHDLISYAALAGVVTALAEAGLREPTIQATLAITPLLENQEDPENRFATLAEIVRAVLQVGGPVKDLLGRIRTGAAALDDEQFDFALIGTLGPYIDLEDGPSLYAALTEIRSPATKNQMIASFAPSLAKLGQVELAQQLADALPDLAQRDRTLLDISLKLAESGAGDSAFSTAEKIQDTQEKGWALQEVGIALAMAGDLNSAQKAVALIMEGHSEERAYVAQRVVREIALAYAREGDFSQARSIVESIEGAYARSQAWQALFRVMIPAGEQEAVYEIMREDRDSLYPAPQLHQVVEVLAEQGALEPLVDQANSLARSAAAGLAAALLATGRLPLAERIMDQIPASSSIASIIRESWYDLVAAGDFEAIERLLGRLVGESTHAEGLVNLAEAAVQTEDFLLIERFAEKALASLEGFDDETQAAALKFRIIQLFLYLDNEAKVNQLVGELDWAKIPDTYVQELFIKIARQYSSETAGVILEALEPPVRQYHLKLRAAAGLQNIGQVEGAGALIEEALAGLWLLGESADLPDPVAAVALGMAQAGQIPLIPLVIDRLEAGPARDQSVLMIIQTLAQNHALQVAWTLADSYLEDPIRGVAYARLARAYGSQENSVGVFELGPPAAKILLDKILPGGASQAAGAWIDLSWAFAQTDGTEAALEAISLAQDELVKLPPESADRLVLTAMLALSHALVDELPRAAALSMEVEAGLGVNIPSEDQASARLFLAEVSSISGDAPAALVQVDRALALRNPFWDPELGDAALVRAWRILLTLNLTEDEFAARLAHLDEDQKKTLQTGLVRDLVNRFEIEAAVAAAGRLGDPNLVQDHVRDLAVRLAKDGDASGGFTLLMRLSGSAGMDENLISVAKKLAADGWLPAAFQTTVWVQHAGDRIKTLLEIILYAAEVSGPDVAVDVWEMALEEPQRAELWDAMMDALSQAGQFGRMAELAEASGDEGAYQQAMKAEAVAEARAGNISLAADIVEDTIMKDHNLQEDAYREIAQVALEAGADEAALAVIQRIPDDWARDYAYGTTAEHLAERGDFPAALRALALIGNPDLILEFKGRIAGLGQVEGEVILPPEEILAAMDTARQKGRDALFRVLESAAPILARADEGEMLVGLLERIVDVESWWSDG